MEAYVEVRSPTGSRLVSLRADRVTIGKADDNDLALPADGLASRLHAVLERYGASGWTVRDLGSRNGTYVNGERVSSERALRAGDQVRVGETLVVLRVEAPEGATATAAAEPAPDLTRREREVLIALCRPVLEGNLLTEPASARRIADDLVITESAVKKHLLRMYDKFGLHEGDDRRRGKLANEAIRRGAVSIGDLRGA